MDRQDLAQHIEKQKLQDEVAEVISTLLNLINHSASEDVTAGIVKGLSSGHRTLQQLLVGATVQALIEYGNDGYSDARNEASKLYCRELEAPVFPYI